MFKLVNEEAEKQFAKRPQHPPENDESWFAGLLGRK